MLLRQIFDPKLAQYSYLVGCQRTLEALLVDPERDIDRYLDLAQAEGLTITAVAETHIHADFLSGARELSHRIGARLFLSDEGDSEWKYEWAKNGEYDVTFLKDGDRFQVGGIEIQAMHSPGHTPEHLSFLVVDRGGGMNEAMGLLSGDFVFVGDLGRPDLLESAAGYDRVKEPSARRLFQSLTRFLMLPDFIQVWPAHGAGSACGKALGAVPTSTVGYERRANGAIASAALGQEGFVQAILAGQPEPPLYFGRMKQLNKLGVPLLGALPQPRPFGGAEFAARAEDPGTVVLDTRSDRLAFMSGHLPAALHTPLDRTFPTVSGAFVRPDEKILLVIERERLDEAVRSLIRIGLDQVEGFIDPEDLDTSAERAHIAVIDFTHAEALRRSEDVAVLDVRGQAEFAAGHIPNAINIAHTRMLERMGELPRERELVVHCGSGARAAASVSLLQREGFRVRLVDGPFTEYASTAPKDVGVPAG